jgi:hypothetical protein
LTGQITSLAKYLVNSKLHHKRGELDEDSLKLAQESIEPSLRPLIGESINLDVSINEDEEVRLQRSALAGEMKEFCQRESVRVLSR